MIAAVGRLGGWVVRVASLGTALLTTYPPNRLTAQSAWRPEDRVLISDFADVEAIAASPWVVCAATTHGLTIYDRMARTWRPPVTALEGYPALDAGDPGGGVFVRTATGWAFVPRGALSSVAGSLGRVADTLVVLTPDQFAWRNPTTGGWTLIRARSDLGAIRAVVGDTIAGGVWIAGSTAVALWEPARGTFHVLRAPYDVPAAVHDVAADARYLWVATDSGLVRFTRSAALGR